MDFVLYCIDTARGDSHYCKLDIWESGWKDIFNL